MRISDWSSDVCSSDFSARFEAFDLNDRILDGDGPSCGAPVPTRQGRPPATPPRDSSRCRTGGAESFARDGRFPRPQRSRKAEDARAEAQCFPASRRQATKVERAASWHGLWSVRRVVVVEEGAAARSADSLPRMLQSTVVGPPWRPRRGSSIPAERREGKKGV